MIEESIVQPVIPRAHAMMRCAGARRTWAFVDRPPRGASRQAHEVVRLRRLAGVARRRRHTRRQGPRLAWLVERFDRRVPVIRCIAAARQQCRQHLQRVLAGGLGLDRRRAPQRIGQRVGRRQGDHARHAAGHGDRQRDTRHVLEGSGLLGPRNALGGAENCQTDKPVHAPRYHGGVLPPIHRHPCTSCWSGTRACRAGAGKPRRIGDSGRTGRIQLAGRVDHNLPLPQHHADNGSGRPDRGAIGCGSASRRRLDRRWGSCHRSARDYAGFKRGRARRARALCPHGGRHLARRPSGVVLLSANGTAAVNEGLATLR